MRCYVCNSELEAPWFELRKRLYILAGGSRDEHKGNHINICYNCTYKYFFSKSDLTRWMNCYAICYCEKAEIFTGAEDTYYVLTSRTKTVTLYSNIFHTKCFEDASGIRLDIDNGD